MNVIDLLKEKSDRLAKNRAEIMDLVNPQVRGYFIGAMNNARNNQWLSWVLDQTKFGVGTEAQNSDQAWPEKMGSDAQKMLQQLSAQMNQRAQPGPPSTGSYEKKLENTKVLDSDQQTD